MGRIMSENATPIAKKESPPAAPPKKDLSPEAQKVLDGLREELKKSQIADQHHDEIIENMRQQLIANTQFNRRALIGTALLAFASVTGSTLYQMAVGAVVDKVLTNSEGVALLENHLTGRCSFAGEGKKTPYDLTVTNALARAQHDLDGQKFGHCFYTGGSSGNFLAASSDGFEFSIAAGQMDVYADMKARGHIDSLELLAEQDEARFESALIATADKSLKSLADIRARVAAASPEKPFVIAVPSEKSGSYFTAKKIMELGVVRGDPALEGRYTFIHYDQTARRMDSIHGPGGERSDITISVQYPGEVDGEYRSARAYIAENPETHMVDITPEEFQAGFGSIPVPYGYHLRHSWINGKLVHMLSVGVILAARKPESIENAALRAGVAERNSAFQSYFTRNPGLLRFSPSVKYTFPVDAKPACSGLSRRQLFCTPSRDPG
jgi:hypothetical protein